jgi:hypothetical protein
VSLDVAIDLFSFPIPNHIKLDVDGAEALVLEGAERTLGRPELRSVLVEANADTGRDVTSRLESAGLRLAKTHIRDKPGAPWYGVFERTSVRS